MLNNDSNSDPLQPGQQVFLKRPVQIYARVIGPLASDWGLPPEQVYYAVELLPLRQHYLPSDLELANQPFYIPTESATEPAYPREVVLKTTTGDALLELAQEIHDRVARRAYEIYESRGSADGHDAEDWFSALSEILAHVPIEIAETESQLIVHADVPGVSAKDLQLSVAPASVCIAGRRQAPPRHIDETPVYSDRRADRIFRVLDLPCEVDPNSVVASVSDGILQVKLPKAASRPVAIDQAQSLSA